MNEIAYGKILGTQELGYRRGVPRGGGPYILISKKFTNIFPPLSQNIRNDRYFVDVLYNDNLSKATCAYVYHNDKHIDNPISGRDEYRLYLNQSIHPGEQVFKPDDWVFFRLCETSEGNFIHIQHYPSSSGGLGEFAENTTPISRDQRNRNFTCASELLPPLPDYSNLEELPIIDDSLAKHANSSSSSRSGREMSPSQFRAFIMAAYDSKCVISGESIRFGKLNNCEAAHIMAHAHDGPMLPDNGIPLSRDLHWAFDNGMFTINDDLTVNVHPEVMDTSLQEINEVRLRDPNDIWSSFAPKKEYLQWHQNNFFGKFIGSVA